MVRSNLKLGKKARRSPLGIARPEQCGLLSSQPLHRAVPADERLPAKWCPVTGSSQSFGLRAGSSAARCCLTRPSGPARGSRLAQFCHILFASGSYAAPGSVPTPTSPTFRSRVRLHGGTMRGGVLTRQKRSRDAARPPRSSPQSSHVARAGPPRDRVHEVTKLERVRTDRLAAPRPHPGRAADAWVAFLSGERVSSAPVSRSQQLTARNTAIPVPRFGRESSRAWPLRKLTNNSQIRQNAQVRRSFALLFKCEVTLRRPRALARPGDR